MDSGAPMPGIRVCDDGLLVAYVVADSEAGADQDEYAVVKFEGVLQHTFGYPNDEALSVHPLYDKGLVFYAFNEVLVSPYVAELARRNEAIFPGSKFLYETRRHWIVTFHDETLEVIGNTAVVLGQKIAASSQKALCHYVT